MKLKQIFAIAFFVAIGSTVANAQPMEAAPAMAPAMAPVAPMPAATAPKVAPMAKAPMDTTMAVTVPMDAPKEAKEAPKKDAPKETTKETKEASKAQTTVSEWKKPEFWISKIILPVFLFVLGLGWFKKTWAQWMKEKGILVVADKVASGFEAYATQTPALWDDALAQALKAVIARFGSLTDEQQAKVKAVVEERKAQAEAKTAKKDEGEK